MRELSRLYITLFVLLAISACATTKKESRPPYEFSGMTLSKNISRAGDLAIARDVTTVFYTDDVEVISLLTFSNISGSHYLRWEWYAPNNDLYYATPKHPIIISEGKYRKKLNAWHRLTISGDKAATLSGTWKVKALIDDDGLTMGTFTLKLTDIENIGQTQKIHREDWALVIGIEDYSELPRVDYAKSDALLVKMYFHKLLGVPEENIITLLNKDATKSKIEGYIRNYLPGNISSDTTLYVYYAGHGAPDTAKGAPYLVPYDGDTRFLGQSAYNLKTFYEDLNRLKLKRVFVFIDSCFSGVAARSSEMLTKGARLALTRVQNPTITTDKVISMNATNEAQISNSFEKQRHGLFTYYLLNGLRGAATSNKNKDVSVKGLYAYVLNNVSREARREGTEQTPTITPPLEKVNDIVINR